MSYAGQHPILRFLSRFWGHSVWDSREWRLVWGVLLALCALTVLILHATG